MEPRLATYNNAYNRKQLGLLDDQNLAAKHYYLANKLGVAGITDELDPVQLILTVCVIMYSSDFLELDEPTKVEEVQTMYANLLQRYVIKRN